MASARTAASGLSSASTYLRVDSGVASSSGVTWAVLVALAGLTAKADCALISGDAIHSTSSQKPYLDVIDEWEDIAELPFVHCVAITREEYFNDKLKELLFSSQQAGRIELEGISSMLAKERNLDAEEVYQFLLRFTYGLDEVSTQSLEMFFKMSYYHGMLADVPEINIAR